MKAIKGKSIKPRVAKTRAIKDCATGEWTYEFKFIQQDGRTARVLVPGDEADTPKSLARRLAQRGARLPRAADERKALLEGVIEAEPAETIHQVASAGWQPHKDPWMSVGDQLIGAPSGMIGYAPPALITRSHASSFGKSGTLDDWKSRVAEKATFSTCITVCIATSFAAPLLAFARRLNFALALYGPSRAGKTTALLCATSIYAYGREEDLPNWNSSGARMLESATAFSDLVFPLNEVGAARGRRKNAYEPQRDLYAQYAEGRDRDRHSSWKGGQGAAPQQFRGICISTAEHSVAEYAMLAGETRDAGELFRAIDVKAIRSDGTTILDLAPDGLDQRGCLEELRTALSECHGTAFQPYLEFLQSLGRDEIEAQTRNHIESFVRQMPGATDGVARGIATNFGLLYAGGALAIRAQVLPWTEDHLLQALTRAFADAIEASKVIDPLDMGLDILKAKLAAHVVERKGGAKFGVKEHAGYWTVSGGVKAFVVHTRQFGGWFPSKQVRDVVLNWLRRGGLLKSAQVGSATVVTPEDLKGVLRRWPDGSLVRSFEFSDPFPDQRVADGVRQGTHADAPTGNRYADTLKRHHARPSASGSLGEALSARGIGVKATKLGTHWSPRDSGKKLGMPPLANEQPAKSKSSKRKRKLTLRKRAAVKKRPLLSILEHPLSPNKPPK